MSSSPSSPKRSVTPREMEIAPTADTIDLTLDSDDDGVSEIPRTEFIDSAFVKKELEEPVGLSDEISEFQRETERVIAQSVEKEVTSGSPGASENPRATSRATPTEAAGHEGVATPITAAENGAQENVQEAAFIPPRPIAPPPLSREELIARDQQLDEMLRNGILNFHAHENQNANPPSATPQGSNNSNGQSTPSRTPIRINDQAEDVVAAAEFQKLKNKYESRKQRHQTTFSEDIEYDKACQAETNRIRLKQKKREYAEREARDKSNDEGLFCSDTERSLRDERTDFPAISPQGDSDAPAPKRVKPNRANKIPLSALQESMSVGFDAGNASSKKKSAKKERKRKDSSKKKVSGDKVTKSRGKKDSGKAPKKKGRPRKGPEISNFGSLLNHDLIAEAQANQAKPDAPEFTSTNRKNALAELIASMPADQQKLYGADRTALDKACRAFIGVQSIKAKGKDGWLLKGMRSHLRNYQLLGAAFMRDRENSGTRPYGGIQSDDMGLGKTVMMIANILDGKASDRSPNRTTLIICPPSLTTQWMNEITKHTEQGALGEVLVYRAGTRIMSADPAKTLSGMDVVITTYQEVLRSYPRCEHPAHLVSEEGKSRWWAEHYEKNRGVLHKIFWRRIVLDEAQAIKNHMSQTSIAVRGLLGKHRWALSGTPIQNSLDEFFPYFAFLKVEHTGAFETFKRNFCKKGSALARDRLQAFLQKIMVRRTHKDELFGAPILKLPQINHETIEVEFNEVERAIYRIVKSRFVNKIKAYAKADSIDKRYKAVFVLLLRLRQLTGHILLIQKTLKELLEAEDLERLWKLTENETTKDDKTRKILQTLQQGLAMAQRSSPTTNNGEGESGVSSPQLSAIPVEVDEIVEGTVQGGPAFKFRRYLKSLRDDGHWETLNMRSCCHACGEMPRQPYITSCMHVYCFECLQGMAYEAAQQDNVKVTCKECGAQYENAEPCRGFAEAACEDSTPTSARSVVRKTKKPREDDDEEDADWIFGVSGSMLQSAKTKAATAQIEKWLADDPDAKVIFFTQFMGMIKIMSRICSEREWGHKLFHGSMTFEARDNAITEWSNGPDQKVLLASLRAGGTGLNLTSGSRVIIYDLWFNQSTETQGACRVFRIGQTRDVEIRRFVVKDSVDTDILKMQERKNLEIGISHERRNTKLTTQELLRLFGPLARDEDGEIIAEGEDEPFIFVEDPFEAHDSESDIEELPRTVPARPF